ncbi:hypothetical protein EMPG_13526 [Blastomyces silverae]|uniref:Beta-lactamase n=1 Tax=Blastomyces silverae TaxID=2060906 RepID=A0A0H1BPS0_9EURO|nr:hypothetical protein EMPG_13526 [Blastomyces silverae]
MLSAISLGGGEVNGVRLLSRKTIDLIFQEQANGIDLGTGVSMPENAEKVCFWGGWGGSIAIVDVQRRMTIAYMMNKMAPGVIGSARSEAYLKAIYAAAASL